MWDLSLTFITVTACKNVMLYLRITPACATSSSAIFHVSITCPVALSVFLEFADNSPGSLSSAAPCLFPCGWSLSLSQRCSAQLGSIPDTSENSAQTVQPALAARTESLPCRNRPMPYKTVTEINYRNQHIFKIQNVQVQNQMQSYVTALLQCDDYVLYCTTCTDNHN